jgi:very-short-patch-repair endonuclease
MAARLVVEVDGSQHGRNAESVRDASRTAWLKSKGYRVLRFWNNEITENVEGVLEAIYSAVYGSVGAEPPPMNSNRNPHGGAEAAERAL